MPRSALLGVDVEPVWPDLDVDLAALRPGLGFPSPALVRAAASLHGRLADQTPNAYLEREVQQEGRQYLLWCAPGAVTVQLVDHNRRQISEAVSRQSIPYGWTDAAGVWHKPTPHRVITEWTRKSRANMTRVLAELDYAPLFDAGRQPAMLTLTYPGDWRAVAPSGRVVKRHVRTLMKRWRRAWGNTPAYVWKLEFQRRGAPHLHLFATPEHGNANCSCCGRRLAFAAWLSHAWADVVGADDQVVDERGLTERARHQLAGTGVDFAEGARATDPKRLAKYFAKHGGAAGGKEYQHRVPIEWQHAERGPGRFWGYSGLHRVRSGAYVDHQAYVRQRRTLRRLSESQGLWRETRVERGPQLLDEDTGELRRRRRKVRRRLRRCGQGGLTGGFLLVNDGPVLVAALARLDEPSRVRWLP